MSQRKPKPQATRKKKQKPKATAPRTALPGAPSFSSASPLAASTAALLKLDLGCGPNKKAGFYGVDQYPMPGVDMVFDLGDITATWPWPAGSVEEVNCSHFFEHLGAMQRIHFLNELYRVLVPGGKATITTPYWASSRAYGDPTHAWPPVGEMTFFYAAKEWRRVNAPHTDAAWLPGGFSCNFEFTAGYSLHPEVQPRNAELQQKMVTFLKEAAQDMIATLVRLPD